MDAILEEVGEDLKKIWRNFVTHYIDLMLEDFEKILLHKYTIANGKRLSPTSIQGLVLLFC